jgi:hypothetical protein
VTAPRSRGTIYVDRSAEPGGDGSQKRPYRTLGEAMAANRTGKAETYMIAPGSYGEFLEPPKPPKKRGRPKKKREPEGEDEL